MRESGILLPISSLPSDYGIGCFDEEARRFIDQLAGAGQRVWQVLPFGPTGYGDSPYQPFSVYAGNPYFISLKALVEKGWLSRADCESVNWGSDPRRVDYGTLYNRRFVLLQKAFAASGIENTADFQAFIRENPWLDDYALFMALKNAHSGASWQDWEEPLKRRDPQALAAARERYRGEITFQCFIQYCFFTQWREILDYAHSKQVRILGDIPIYVSMDSADVWAQPRLFQLDEDLRPAAVAGCPPDAFAPGGQLWGNPLYDWDYHQKDHFSWWIARTRFTFTLCDILRIDHFRGFEAYFSIPAGDRDARNGHWIQGPGMAVFDALREALGEREIVAEALGYVTDEVRALIRRTGFADMKVLQFAFDARDTGSASDYLPHNYPENCVAYTGTHDNATLLGWQQEISPAELDTARRYLCTGAGDQDLVWAMVCAALRSVAKLAVIPIQDYLGYGGEARMNKPSTQENNWTWRLLKEELTPALLEKIGAATRLYGRGGAQ